jgi:hypothetical protein
MMNAINSLRVQDFENEEAYLARVQEIVDYYTGKREHAYNQMNVALQNSQVIYNEDWAKYSAATGYKISADQ